MVRNYLYTIDHVIIWPAALTARNAGDGAQRGGIRRFGARVEASSLPPVNGVEGQRMPAAVSSTGGEPRWRVGKSTTRQHTKNLNPLAHKVLAAVARR